MKKMFLLKKLMFFAYLALAATVQAEPTKLYKDSQTKLMKNLKKEVLSCFKKVFRDYEGEVFYKNVTSSPENSLCSAVEGIYDSNKSVFNAENFNIPKPATIALLGISEPGSINALAQAGKLSGNEKQEQVRIFIVPKSKESVVISEINNNTEILNKNHWTYLLVDDATMKNISFGTPGSLEIIAGKIAGFCSAKANALYAGQISSCGTGSIENHIQEIKKNFTNKEYLVRYPNLNKTWTVIGNPATATTEIIALPASSFYQWLTDDSPENIAALKNGTKKIIDCCNIPKRLETIKQSIICVVNDWQSVYIIDQTKLFRWFCYEATALKQEKEKNRFDHYFITLEPTSPILRPCIHYIASTPRDSHNSNTTDNSEETGGKFQIFNAKTENATTLTLSYQAAAAYANKIHTNYCINKG